MWTETNSPVLDVYSVENVGVLSVGQKADVGRELFRSFCSFVIEIFFPDMLDVTS